MKTNYHSDLQSGMVGGTLLSTFAQIQSADLVKTVILASVGAFVSFCISMGMKWVLRFRRRKAKGGR